MANQIKPSLILLDELGDEVTNASPVSGKTCKKLGPMSLASAESLAIPLVQEVVFMADFRCARCQERVAEVMSKMNGEAQSVVLSVMEKKVTLTCTNHEPPRLPISKVSLFMRRFLPSCR